ncbi:hypothetical protein QR98_0106460, partial [Sarcoptes scabiei]
MTMSTKIKALIKQKNGEDSDEDVDKHRENLERDRDNVSGNDCEELIDDSNDQNSRISEKETI